jgi:hypothetical protein
LLPGSEEPADSRLPLAYLYYQSAPSAMRHGWRRPVRKPTPFPFADRLQPRVDDGAGNISGSRNMMICENDLRDALGIDNLEAQQTVRARIRVQLLRPRDQMIAAVERYLDDIVRQVISNAEQPQPLRFNLIAKRKRSDCDLGVHPDAALRYHVENVCHSGRSVFCAAIYPRHHSIVG